MTDLSRRKSNIESKSERCPLQKVMDDLRNFNFEEFLKRLRPKDLKIETGAESDSALQSAIKFLGMDKLPNCWVRTGTGKASIDVEKLTENAALINTDVGKSMAARWQKAFEEKAAKEGVSVLQKPDGTTFKVAGRPENVPFQVVSFTPPIKGAALTAAPG